MKEILMIKKIMMLAIWLAPTYSLAMPLGVKGRVQVAQEVNRDQIVAVQGDQETSVYAHASKKWQWSETVSYDVNFSATSSFRYDTSSLANSNYKISVGLDF